VYITNYITIILTQQTSASVVHVNSFDNTIGRINAILSNAWSCWKL